jgi:hypothetical protein
MRKMQFLLAFAVSGLTGCMDDHDWTEESHTLGSSYADKGDSYRPSEYQSEQAAELEAVQDLQYEHQQAAEEHR